MSSSVDALNRPGAEIQLSCAAVIGMRGSQIFHGTHPLLAGGRQVMAPVTGSLTASRAAWILLVEVVIVVKSEARVWANRPYTS